jgi:hypothetical protein
MRDQLVIALVVVIAIASMFVGYYAHALRDNGGESGDCIFLRERLAHLATVDNPPDSQLTFANDEVVLTRGLYNEMCR